MWIGPHEIRHHVTFDVESVCPLSVPGYNIEIHQFTQYVGCFIMIVAKSVN